MGLFKSALLRCSYQMKGSLRNKKGNELDIA